MIEQTDNSAPSERPLHNSLEREECKESRSTKPERTQVPDGLSTGKTQQSSAQVGSSSGLSEDISDDSQPIQKLNTINISRKRGIPLYFRVSLPPNLAHAAPQDAIIIKIEGKVKNSRPFPLEQLDRSRAFKLSSPHYQVAKLLEEWCNPPPFISLLQLTRRRLLTLVNALKGQPSVFKPDLQEEPLEWVGDVIPGVHEYLVNPEDALIDQEPSKSKTMDTIGVDDETFRPMIIDGSTQFISIELPSRNNPFYKQALDLVKSEGFVLEPANRKWWIRDRHKTLNFLACHWKDLKKLFSAQFTKNFLKRTSSLRFVKVKCKATEGTDDFTINLKLETFGADENNLRQSLARGQYYLQSPKGFVLLQPKVIEQLTKAQRSLSGEPDRSLAPSFYQKLIPPQIIDAENLLDGIVESINAPEVWKKKSRWLKDLSQLKPAPILPALDQKLRGYQKIGAAWLWNLYKNDLGGILADEMGLGKTVQALAFLQCIINQGSQNPKCLVVCPASLVENWRREANIFTPHLKVFCHQGSNRLKDASDFDRYHLIISSYTTLTRDQNLFNQVFFSAIIGDEAQHIKNKQTQNARALKSLNSKGKILLTGTPLENSINDLRSLFDFLMPGYLVDPPLSLTLEERDWFNNRLKDQASPYILRRSKVVVAPELPDKIEQILYCEMDDVQAEEYKRLQEQTQKAIFEMEMAGKSESQIRLAALNQLLRLRQVCADPRILNESLSAENSTKFRVFREVLQESIDSDHRILVFSQFVSVLQLLKKELDEMDIPYCYLDGKTQNRLEVCDKFNKTPSIPVFLISLKAGGVGLNLTGADTVIHFDPWWNPAVENQATDRAHRIGQTKVVSSIKLIVAGSVEEKVLELQNAKSDLLKDVLEASEAANAKISLKEIKDLIGVAKK